MRNMPAVQENNIMLRRMIVNYMTYGLGLVITFIVILAFVAALLAAIFAGLGWKESGDDDDGYVSAYCDDNNPCTKDVMRDGACDVPKPYGSNHACDTSCYAPEEDPNATHLCHITSCPNCARCEGTVCAGSCSTLSGSDCPNITTATITTEAVKDCDSDVCNYYVDMTGLHDSTGIPCDVNSKYWINVCDNEIDSNSTYFKDNDNCLISQPQCSNSTVTTEGEPTLVACYYWFYCAVPVPLILVK